MRGIPDRRPLLDVQLVNFRPASLPAEPVVINDYSKQKNALTLQAEDLVKCFHKLFHGVDAHSPQSKETDQALALLAQHGPERSRHIVEFTRAQAEQTNFKPRHFGAVLS